MKSKYKLSLKKVGGSIYCHIPSGLVEQLDIKQDNEVLASFEKYGDIIRELCNKYSDSGEEVKLTTSDRDLIGVIAFVNNNSIDFMSEGKTYILSFSLIKEVNQTQIPSTDGLNQIKLGDNILN